MPSKSLSLTQQKPHLNTNRSFVTSLVPKFQLILIRHWKTCHSSMWEFMSSCHDFAPIKSKLWLVKFNITQKIRKYFLRILVLLAQSICCILPFWRLLNNGVFHRPLGILNLILFACEKWNKINLFFVTDIAHSWDLTNSNCFSEVIPINYFFIIFVRRAHLILYLPQVYPAQAKTGNRTRTNYGPLLHSSMLTNLGLRSRLLTRSLNWNQS